MNIRNVFNDTWNYLSEPNIKKLSFMGGVLVVIITAGWTIYTEFFHKDSDTKTTALNITASGQSMAAQSVTATASGNGTAINTTGDVNFYRSTDYQALQAELEKNQQHVKDYPDDQNFKQELRDTLKKLEDFKRDVLKLANDFNKIPINTERLKLAKQYFEAGDYKAARTILDAESIFHDQKSLLDNQKRLESEQAETKAALESNAAEFFLKAQLTALDYTLPDRIAKSRQFFEASLKSARTSDTLFTYAAFLQQINEFKESEKLYEEVLGNYQELAKNNSCTGVTGVAETLHNLGLIAESYSYRQNEAEQMLNKTLTIYREIEKVSSDVYVSKRIAQTLNSLGGLISADRQRWEEAEKLISEALKIQRKLNIRGELDMSDIVATLNNLGGLLARTGSRQGEAEQLLTEALILQRKLADTNPDVHLPMMAGTLNNLGTLISNQRNRQNESEKIQTEALLIKRKLAKDSPSEFLPDLAITLTNLGILIANDHDRKPEARQFFYEALRIQRKLAQTNPEIYKPLVARTLVTIGKVNLDWQEPKQALGYLRDAQEILEPYAKSFPGAYDEGIVAIHSLITEAKKQTGN